MKKSIIFSVIYGLSILLLPARSPSGIEGMEALSKALTVVSNMISLEPLKENFPNVSLYSYAVNNPIAFIDPTGNEPVYNKNGVFLGSTSEGFTGDVLIYSGTDHIEFENFTRAQIEAKYPFDIDFYDNVRKWVVGGMDGDSNSRIWTHIASKFEGMTVYDEKFSLSQIKGNKIFYRIVKDAAWGSTEDSEILGTGDYKYDSTVENIASSIIVHEWYSHVMKHTSDPLKSHRLAYKNVINFKKFWNKTTYNYKQFNLEKLLDYTKSETGRKQVDPLYRNLFRKYVK
jgi:hypothetical protein